jgi:GDPmannose 4,6-dehydratase
MAQIRDLVVIVGDQGQDGTLLKISLIKKNTPIVCIGRDGLLMPDSCSDSVRMPFNIGSKEQVARLVKEIQPAQVYYLAAHHGSSEQPSDNGSAEYSNFHTVHVLGLLNFLSAIKAYAKYCRLFYAASSLVFGANHRAVLSEKDPLTPNDFYGLTKAQGILICRHFRQTHGIFCSVGILFNHESVLRPLKFLSKKLIYTAHQISLGREENLVVGSLLSETDWGYAPCYVDAFQKILRLKTPEDFIVATGESHTVSEFAELVFDCFNLDAKKYLREDPSLLTRNVTRKVGDYSNLKNLTGWKPGYKFHEMVQKLVSDYHETLRATNFENPS